MEELQGIQLTVWQLEQARVCAEQCPEGFNRCVTRALKADQPGAALVALLRRDRHLDPVYAELDQEPRITGWTFKHGASGEGGGTYVKDPEGTDVLPANYDFTPCPTLKRTEPQIETTEAELLTYEEWRQREDDAA